MPEFTREDIRQDTEEIVSRVIRETVPGIVEEIVGKATTDEIITEMRAGFQIASDHILKATGRLNNHERRINRLERKVF